MRVECRFFFALQAAQVSIDVSFDLANEIVWKGNLVFLDVIRKPSIPGELPVCTQFSTATFANFAC